MAIGAILGAVSTIAGIGTSLFGQSEQAKAQEKAARAEAQSLAQQARISRKIFNTIKKPAYKRDKKAMNEILAFQRQASAAAAEEQQARLHKFEYDQEFAKNKLERDHSQAVGRSLAQMAASGARGEGTFGNLGQIWSAAMQSRLELNLNTDTGRDIFEAQRKQAAAVTAANERRTIMSRDQLSDQYKLDKMNTRLARASVANTGPAQAAQARAAGISNIGQSLVGLGQNQSVQRFANQVFGQQTPTV